MRSQPDAPPPGPVLRRYFQARCGEMTRLLEKLIRLESPTDDKTAVDLCTSAFLSALGGLGMRVSRVPSCDRGDMFVAELRTRKTPRSAKPMLLLTHSDTVWPRGTITSMPLRIKGDKLYGPGALDMKAGLVQACFSLRALVHLRLHPRRPIRLLINSSEETGSPEAERLITGQALASGIVLCLEPALPGGALKTRRKGRLVVRLETTGKAAHAGSPHLGINALEEMAHQLLALRNLRGRGTTLNIGRVEGGGATNVVADSAKAVVDIRFWTHADKTSILRALARRKSFIAGARTIFHLEGEMPPLENTDVSRRLYSRTRRIAAGLGIRLRAGKTGGGSDASLASSLGRPTLDGLGPDGGGIHAQNEHVLLSSLMERTALLTRLLLEL